MIDRKKAKAKGVATIDGSSHLQAKKEELRDKLRALLPALVNSDGRIDIKALQDAVDAAGSRSNSQDYELSFAGKGLARAAADTPTNYELKKEEKQSKNYESAGNVVIRGDNLDVLKILYQNYYGKIKMIYIDPPYNTGSDGFVYKDNFRKTNEALIEDLGLDAEFVDSLVNVYGARNHSGWLSFMYPRLKLARDLLNDEGVIFISIDDNEMANLKIICDEIFGESNFVACLHVEMSATQGMKVASALKGNIVKNAEHTLVYARNINNLSFFRNLYSSKDWDGHYSIYYNPTTGEHSSLLRFLQKNAKKLSLGDDFRAQDIDGYYDKNKPFRDFIHANADKIWQDAMCDISVNLSAQQKAEMARGKIVEYRADSRIYFLKKTRTDVMRQLLPLGWAIGTTDDFQPGFRIRKIRGDWWPDFYKDMMNINKEGEVVYKNGKKPLRLIRDMLVIASKSGDYVLDFFAGSGTTGEAVMRLNAEDGGNRKFILVQQDEKIDAKKSKDAHAFCVKNKIEPVISSITIERLNRAGKKIKESAEKENSKLLAEKKKLLPDIGYKVYSLSPKPTLDEKRSGNQRLLGLANLRQTTEDTLANMLCAAGEALDTLIECVKKDKIYKTEKVLYLLGKASAKDLECHKDYDIYLDGWADIDLTALLNMGSPRQRQKRQIESGLLTCCLKDNNISKIAWTTLCPP